MTSSGTYTFNPAASDIVLDAYARIRMPRAMLETEHLIDASNQANYLLVEWSNLQPLLWKSELISQALTSGTATYTLDDRVVMVLLGYLQTGTGTNTTARVLGPLSTVEYASLVNKDSQGLPNTFWFNRQITPTITLYFVPDSNTASNYTLYLRVVSRPQDAKIPSGVTMDLPYRFLDAFAAGLAARLARLHKPELLVEAQTEAQRTWSIASGNDVENVPMFITPGVSGYWR